MQENGVIQENKMGTRPVNRLLVSMALPLMISMLVQALYNVVDSVYVAQLSQNALNAVSLSFPIQNLMIAVASGTGVGVNALLSKSLGEKNHEMANKFAINGVFLAICSYIVTLIFGLTCVEVFFRSQTTISEIISGGVDYLSICCCFSFGIYGQIIFERLMQSTGKTIYSMFTQGLGAIVNIILDPILIFGYLGFQPMGVAGAAIATVIGQICSMILGIILNHHFNKEVRIHPKGFRPSGKIIWNIYRIGIPSIIMVSISSVMTYFINKLLIAIETTATAAAVFGAYYKLQSFVFMPVFGLTNAMIPIIGYNLGAGNKHRMLKTYRLSVMYALIVMILGMAAMLFLPNVLLSFFNASSMMMQIGEPALRIICLSFPFAAFGIVAGSFFQACGNGLVSMIMSIARQLVVLVPVAYILGYAAGVEFVWYAFPIAELASCGVAAFGRFYINKKILSKMPEEPINTSLQSEMGTDEQSEVPTAN